ncbi:hypothetical protein ACH5RR_000406 [Cinchona calisaya]|uniref:Uncharacterized protein n=1 Tax=Cinchona calisaya TaxID=153742 RepID=A0ABD3B0J1_9GENT
MLVHSHVFSDFRSSFNERRKGGGIGPPMFFTGAIFHCYFATSSLNLRLPPGLENPRRVIICSRLWLNGTRRQLTFRSEKLFSHSVSLTTLVEKLMRFVYLHFAGKTKVGNRKKLSCETENIHGQNWQTIWYVCKASVNVIRKPSFFREYLLKSKGGLLIQQYKFQSHGLFVDMKGRNCFVMYLRHDFPGKPLDSCRGLYLFHIPYGRHLLCSQQGKRTDDLRALHLVNPITMQIEVLSSLGDEWVQHCQLAYIRQTRQYMVVCIFNNYGTINGLVLTLGVDLSWRKLNFQLVGGISNGLLHATLVIVGEAAYISQSGNRHLFGVQVTRLKYVWFISKTINKHQ